MIDGATAASQYAKVLSIAEAVAFDMGRQLTIVSAYRDPANNEKAGGEKLSRHMFGEAMDIRIREMNTTERVEFVRLLCTYGALAFGFYEVRPRPFIHFDIYRKRKWGPQPKVYEPVLKQFKICPFNV